MIKFYMIFFINYSYKAKDKTSLLYIGLDLFKALIERQKRIQQ